MRVDTCIRSITLLATIRYKKKRRRKREKKKKKQTNKQTKEPFYLLTPDILAFRPLYKTTSKYVPSQDFAFPCPFQTLSRSPPASTCYTCCTFFYLPPVVLNKTNPLKLIEYPNTCNGVMGDPKASTEPEMRRISFNTPARVRMRPEPTEMRNTAAT